MPVMDGEAVVGSLSEAGVLAALLENPEAREQPVSTVMAEPIPVVPSSIGMEHLSSYLGQDPGAVLVKGDDGAFHIITKSDLIGALAGAGA